MTLSCLLSRPWRLPYAEQDSRGARGWFAALAWGHFQACASCQAECARLRATGAALQQAARVSRRRRTAVRDNLGSTVFAERVMTRVQRDEGMRRRYQFRQQRQLTATFPVGWALAGLGIAFALFGPPSLARTWLKAAFPPVRATHHHRAAKPPFAMHDPFGGITIGSGHGYLSHAARAQSARSGHAILPGHPNPVKLIPDVFNRAVGVPPSAGEDAREATIVAEEAERTRWEHARAVVMPSPDGARLAAAGGPRSRTAAQSAPPLLPANADPSLGTQTTRSKTPPVTTAATNDATGDTDSRQKARPASPDDLRSFGLAPSTPPPAPAPSADLGASSTGSAP